MTNLWTKLDNGDEKASAGNWSITIHQGVQEWEVTLAFLDGDTGYYEFPTYPCEMGIQDVKEKVKNYLIQGYQKLIKETKKL